MLFAPVNDYFANTIDYPFLLLCHIPLYEYISLYEYTILLWMSIWVVPPLELLWVKPLWTLYWVKNHLSIYVFLLWISVICKNMIKKIEGRRKKLKDLKYQLDEQIERISLTLKNVPLYYLLIIKKTNRNFSFLYTLFLLTLHSQHNRRKEMLV